MVKKGERIVMIYMANEPRPIQRGEQGTVVHVDDAGSIHVDWDNGRRLAVIPEVDQFVILPKTETL